MPENLPYVTAPGVLKQLLQKIQSASVPSSFSHDFVQTKLGIKSGSAKAVVPFVKKMGFATPDGTPTQLYKEFRNKSRAGHAVASAMRQLYSQIFQINEYACDLGEEEIKGIIVQVTGNDPDAQVTKLTYSTFSLLCELADFSTEQKHSGAESNEEQDKGVQKHSQDDILNSLRDQLSGTTHTGEGINLSYTINLNLPATSDIEVFNAIFKSLKQHLLDQ